MGQMWSKMEAKGMYGDTALQLWYLLEAEMVQMWILGAKMEPKLRPEVTNKGSEKTTSKTEGSVLHFGIKSDQK